MNINLYTWHTERRLTFCPKHFTLVKVELKDESKLWILERLSGRYFIGYHNDSYNADVLFADTLEYPSFEDPQEAVLFELTWS